MSKKKKARQAPHLGIMCLKCLDRIFSWSRHDFRTCSCGCVAIDGGFDYCKVSGDAGDWKMISVTAKDKRCRT